MEYFDNNGVEIKKNDRVCIIGRKHDPGKEWHGVIMSISDPDGDVDDEGRAYGIPPKVHVKFDDDAYEFFTCFCEEAGGFVCEDIERADSY